MIIYAGCMGIGKSTAAQKEAGKARTKTELIRFDKLPNGFKTLSGIVNHRSAIVDGIILEQMEPLALPEGTLFRACFMPSHLVKINEKYTPLRA